MKKPWHGPGALLSILLALSACGGKTADAGTELRFGFMTEPTTLDPLAPSNTADGRSIFFNVFEGLVKVSPDGDFDPALAKSWREESGGLVWIFSLREGIRFQDGSPVTVDDAVFSFQTVLDRPPGERFSGFDRIAAIEAAGERELRITLHEPDPEFLPYLTLGIVPRNNADREKNPVGTGPFRIASWKAQESLVLEKNPYYWDPELPKLDRVVLVFVPDSTALLIGLRSGNTDGAVLTASLFRQLPEDTFDAVQGRSNAVQMLALNNAVPPLDDSRVRQALCYAVSAEEIIDMAFFGQGEASGSPLIPGLRQSYEESLRNAYPPGLERAKSLLAQAGFPDGFSLKITVPSAYAMHVDTAQVIVSQLARIGVKAEISLVEWVTWLKEVYTDRNYQATVISVDGTTASPQAFLSRYQSDQGSNFVNFRSAEFDRTYRSAIAETDAARRTALYREAQKIISREAASVFIQDILSFQIFRRGLYGGAVASYPVYVTDFAHLYRKQ